ncbi:MAG: hypothetical protein ACFHVJ_14905 [Aestuariibacter sp.]
MAIRKQLNFIGSILFATVFTVLFGEVAISNSFSKEKVVVGTLKEFSCGFADKYRINNAFYFTLNSGKRYHNSDYSFDCSYLDWLQPNTEVKMTIKNKRVLQLEVSGTKYFHYWYSRKRMRQSNLTNAVLALCFPLLGIWIYFKRRFKKT